MSVRILVGDVRDKLEELPDESVHCVVTSPPYYGLRDYGVAGQIGLEATPDEYVAQMVAVFGEVRRVLRPDGTLWLNLGDSYAQGGSGGYSGKSTLAGFSNPQTKGRQMAAMSLPRSPVGGMKPKDLCGIPWRVAFALQEDGWWLRQDIIWAKPNPMPESVTDRCTKAHEYLFLLSKSERYSYDADAIAEPVASSTLERLGQPNLANQKGSDRVPGKTNGPMRAVYGGRNKHARYGTRIHSGNEDTGAYVDRGANKRSVWTVATAPYREAHFATFPPALVEPCILAGCPKGGAVLDPFGGAGTTGLVADRLGRDAILIELNPKYAEMARRRINEDRGPLFAEAAD